MPATIAASARLNVGQPNTPMKSTHGALEAEPVDEIAHGAAEDHAESRPVARRREDQRRRDAGDHGRDQDHEHHAGAGEPAERDPRVVVEVDAQAADDAIRQADGLVAHEPFARLIDGEDAGGQRQRQA